MCAKESNILPLESRPSFFLELDLGFLPVQQGFQFEFSKPHVQAVTNTTGVGEAGVLSSQTEPPS